MRALFVGLTVAALGLGAIAPAMAADEEVKCEEGMTYNPETKKCEAPKE